MAVLQLLLNGVVSGSILGMVAISFSLVYATTGVFHVAHAGVFTLGAYLVWSFMKLGLPGPAALVLGVAACAAVGALMQQGLYRPLAVRGATPLVVMIASLGLLAIVENLIAAVFTPDILLFPTWWGKDVVAVGPLSVTKTQLLTIATGFGAYAALMLFSQRTLLGKKIRAVSSNPFLAEIGQLAPLRVYVAVYAIASMIVCLPGVLIAVDFGLRPYSGIYYLLVATIAMIAGGVGSLTGAFFVAFVIAILQNLSLLVVPSQWSVGVTFFLFVVVMLFRPRGVFGRAR